MLSPLGLHPFWSSAIGCTSSQMHGLVSSIMFWQLWIECLCIHPRMGYLGHHHCSWPLCIIEFSHSLCVSHQPLGTKTCMGMLLGGLVEISSIIVFSWLIVCEIGNEAIRETPFWHSVYHFPLDLIGEFVSVLLHLCKIFWCSVYHYQPDLIEQKSFQHFCA